MIFSFPLVLLMFLLNLHTVFAQTPEVKRFIFGTNSTTVEGENINCSLVFSEDKTSFGFDFNSSEKVIFKNNGFTAISPVYFSLEIPEGNYEVTVVLGSEEGPSETTVKAESRRLMLNRIKVPKGEQKTEKFTVNVRTPAITSQENITLKSREIAQLNWDNKLTLEFSGNVAVRQILIEEISNNKTLYLAGDSTVTDQDLEPWASWGQMITRYLKPEIVVANYAASGESLSSFKGRKRLEKILSIIKPGDYLIIEFGHNDQKQKGEGMGPWLSYTNSLVEYVKSTREKEAIPILVTPTQRRFFSENGKLKDTHGEYPDAMRKVAKDLNVPLLDISAMTIQMYESWGDDLSRKAFVQYPAQTFPGQVEKLEDNTHFNSFGANEVALAVIHGTRNLKLDLKNYIKPEAPEYDPARPNHPSTWTTPLSSRFESIKPDGN